MWAHTSNTNVLELFRLSATEQSQYSHIKAMWRLSKDTTRQWHMWQWPTAQCQDDNSPEMVLKGFQVASEGFSRDLSLYWHSLYLAAVTTRSTRHWWDKPHSSCAPLTSQWRHWRITTRLISSCYKEDRVYIYVHISRDSYYNGTNQD